KLSHYAVAVFYAAQEGGGWKCPDEISWADDQDVLNPAHPVAFSAKGTHATYPSAGEHRSKFITDVTGHGSYWDGWRSLRPLVLEPYYGYSGAWGDVKLLSFISGPLVPG